MNKYEIITTETRWIKNTIEANSIEEAEEKLWDWDHQVEEIEGDANVEIFESKKI